MARWSRGTDRLTNASYVEAPGTFPGAFSLHGRNSWPKNLRLSDSSLSLPAPFVVGLPVGDVEALGLAVGPALARRGDCVEILAIEQQHDALVRIGVGG